MDKPNCFGNYQIYCERIHGGCSAILDCKTKKPSKYHNVKTVVDGITFDSVAESVRYGELKLLERAGQITELELQPYFLLQEGFKKGKKVYKPITYFADFKYREARNNQIVIEDVKGKETKEFQIKRKMFEDKYPELTLTLIK